MASIDSSSNSRTSKTKKHLIHLDMTPMVDLGFLLISFFILTTSMQPKGQGLNVFLPSESTTEDTSKVQKQTYHLLLANNETFYCYPTNHIAKVVKLEGIKTLTNYIEQFTIIDSVLQIDAKKTVNTFCLQPSPTCEVQTIVDVLSIFYKQKIKNATLQTEDEGEFATCKKLVN